MKISVTICETIKTTKLSDGSSSEAISTVVGTVIARGQSQFQVLCDPRQAIGNSRATIEANDVRVEANHHATCKELRLETREVGVEHISTRPEGSLYLITVL